MEKAHLFACSAPGIELSRGDKGVDAEVLLAGLKVLADGNDVAVYGAQVGEDLTDFCVGFAEASHDAGFGVGPGGDRAGCFE